MILQTVPDSIVPLDVLNNHYQPLARYEARLLDLRGDWATLALPASASVSCLHWGSLVRFTFTDGAYCCQAEGIVVAHRVSEAVNVAQEAAAGMGRDRSGKAVFPSPLPLFGREITVQLWQCHQREERRMGPRRWPRIAVLLRPQGEALPHIHTDAATEASAAEECWERGWAIDFSANGMRLRTHVCLPLKQRVALQFALPDSSASAGVSDKSPEEAQEAKRRFTVTGRVLRSERTRAASSHQAMICFEQLLPEEGLALSRFLQSG